MEMFIWFNYFKFCKFMKMANTEISPVHTKVSCYKSAMQARGEIASITTVQSLNIQLEENTTAGSWLILMGNRLMRGGHFSATL
jgi:hypothetical protein